MPWLTWPASAISILKTSPSGKLQYMELKSYSSSDAVFLIKQWTAVSVIGQIKTTNKNNRNKLNYSFSTAYILQTLLF
jgi:hypothetical protein